MPKTMKAAVVHRLGAPLVIEDVLRPSPGPGEVLVKVAVSGVCHTDLHAAEGDWPIKPSPPFIPGHEGVGHVAALGAGVTTLQEGDLVGVPWLHSACGRCEYCLSGRETLCEKQKNTGYSVNGSFAEYMLAQADYVARLPSGLNLASLAPVLCAGLTVYKGLKATDVRPGQWVVVSGVGGLGHMAIQYAQAMGLRVAAVDVSDDKVQLAKRLGATFAFNALTTDPVAAMQREFGRAHGALVTAVSLSAFEQAMRMVRRGGTVTLTGLPPGSFPLPVFDAVLNEITVRGSIVGTRLDLQEALQFAENGIVGAVAQTARLDDVNDVFERMRRGQIEGRIVLDMGL